MAYPLRQLIEQLEAIDAQLAEMRAEMRDAKLAEARAIIEEFELTAYELGLVRTQHVKRNGRDARTWQAKAKSQPRPALYRDPATGRTWTGHGRPPGWIEGDRDEYLIQEA
jgi:DNA-binding protein H-NS